MTSSAPQSDPESAQQSDSLPPAAVTPTLRAKRHQMMVHEIAEVALVLFLARGFHETTIDQVAEAAGISRRTFFRYFKTKEEVVFVALDTLGA